MSAMKNLLSTYTDAQGVEHEAVFLTWAQVRGILGRDHDGSAEDDRRLVSELRAMGAPPWIDGAAGWIDSEGWGLIGPRLSVDVTNPWSGVSVTLTRDDVTPERLEAFAVLMPNEVREELHREHPEDPWSFFAAYVDRVGPEEAGKIWFS